MKTQANVLAWILLLAPIANSTPDGGVLPPVRSTHYATASNYTLPHSPAFNSSVSMTAEAWVYRDGDTRVETILSHELGSSFWFGFLAKKIYFFRSGGDSALSTGEVLAKRWTHVAVSYNGTEARFYIDGQLDSVKALSNSGIGAASTLKIGADHTLSTAGFHGHLDEIRIWSRAKTAAAINFNRTVELTSETGLEAVFPHGNGWERISGIVCKKRIPHANLAAAGDQLFEQWDRGALG